MQHFHIKFLKNIPQNSSEFNSVFNSVQVFLKWFVFVRVTVDERSVQ